MSLLTFALVLGACPDDSGTPSDRSTLKLSGQVYTQNIDISSLDNPQLGNPQKFNNTLSISDDGLGGSGEIKNGQLNYSIGVPLNLSPVGEDGYLDSLKEMYPSLKLSSKDVKATAVALETIGSDEYSGLLKSLLDLKLNPVSQTTDISIDIGIETVNYVYVDNDLKITADPDSFEYNTGYGFPISLTTEKINLSLKKGWNSLYSKITAQVVIPFELLLTQDPSVLDMSALKPKGNLKTSIGDSSKLNWTLVPSEPPDIEQ